MVLVLNTLPLFLMTPQLAIYPVSATFSKPPFILMRPRNFDSLFSMFCIGVLSVPIFSKTSAFLTFPVYVILEIIL